MTFKKLRQLVMVAFCGLTFGSHMTALASDSTPDKVTIELHKMDNKKRKRIKNTGDVLTPTDGVIAYDAEKYGAVTFSVYNLTDLFKERGVVSGATTSEKFETERNRLLREITGKQRDPLAVLEAQAAFVAKYDLPLVDSEELTDQTGALTFPNIDNKGFYLIMETKALTKNLLALSAPMIIGLPLNDKATIHLYPKNFIARDVDPEIHKVGLDPEDPTGDNYVSLGNVKFTLARKDDEGDPRILETDKDGNIVFGGLEVGTEYVLTESDNQAHSWYKQANTKGEGKLSLTFTVDKDGIIYPKETLPDTKHFEIVGTRIGIRNDLILGQADFKKVDTQTNKGLAGAKFKVQKVDAAGKTFWAEFKDGIFVKWLTEKSEATELVSLDDGTFGFTGVPYVYDRRDGPVTYNLVETQAPAGYTLLKSATEFEINEQTNVMTIKNDSHALPTTGGMGIWLFVLIGSLLMGGAGYLYYRQRKGA